MEQAKTILTGIVINACKGDLNSRSILYEKFSKAMYNICLRMAGNKPQAEDLLHDSFIIAFKNLDQLKQPEAFAGWLRRITVNECVRQSRAVVKWNDLDDRHENISHEDAGWWDLISPETVQHAIKHLPDGCRQVFVLYVLEDYSHKQIADELGITEGTSKSQYHRSRELLRERIIQHQLKAEHG